MIYDKTIIPKALFLTTFIPNEMVDRLNELLDRISKDRKHV